MAWLEIMQYLPYIGLALITLAFATALYFLCRGYERMLDKADKRYDSLFDRWLLTKNLPPAAANLGRQYEERRAQTKAVEAEKAARGPKPHMIGEVDRVQSQLLAEAAAQRRSGAIV
jgi:hypothetical protein